MMRCKLMVVAAFLITTTTYAATNPSDCKFGRQTLPSVTCYGPANLNQTTVTSATQVEGDFKGRAVTLGALTVDGTVNLHESIIKGLTNVYGNLNAHQVNFQNGLSVKADKVTLSDSSVQGSMVISSDKNTPSVSLLCGAKVTGSVTFIGRPGIVFMSDDGNLQGKIHNGELKFVDVKCATKALQANNAGPGTMPMRLPAIFLQPNGLQPAKAEPTLDVSSSAKLSFSLPEKAPAIR